MLAMRVLVVEDEVKMAGLLKRALEEEGYAVDVAGYGAGLPRTEERCTSIGTSR